MGDHRRVFAGESSGHSPNAGAAEEQRLARFRINRTGFGVVAFILAPDYNETGPTRGL